MKVLVACEFSGVVREAFRKQGHDAWSCDLYPTKIPGNHIQDDVLKHLDDGWDLMVAHPPCTYLANSGSRWLYKYPERWKQLENGANFFKKLLNANIPKIAIENPIPHKYAVNLIGRKYDQLIQPYQFGEKESKPTCFWLKNLPKLVPTKIMEPEWIIHNGKKWSPKAFLYFTESNHKLRMRERSRTFKGIAEAMAEQWGNPKQITF